MRFRKNEIAALTRMFSASVLNDFGNRERSSLFSRLIRETRFAVDDPTIAVRDAFDQAFQVLKQLGVRDEYVYKAAITQKLLLGRHSLKTATSIYEARAGSCKADLVVLNGTSTAYEIKSERDSLMRLSNQIENYRKVFATVNVVCSPTHASQVLELVPPDVGVMVLSRRFTLQTQKAATITPERTSALAILNTLRTPEAVSILENLSVEVPTVPNTQRRSMLEDLFADLDPASVHDQMVTTLRQTRSHSAQAHFLDSVPNSLKAAALAIGPTGAQRERISKALDTPLPVALAWS